MTQRILPLVSSALLLALLVPACDNADIAADIDDTADADDSDPRTLSDAPGVDELAAPLPASKAELDALADAGEIVRSTPETRELADSEHLDRLRAAEQRIRAASREHGDRLAAIIAPVKGLQLTKEGNYRVKIADAELGQREVITMGPAATTLDLAAALDGLESPSNALAAYRALHDGLTPAARVRLGAPAPDSLASAKAREIRAEIDRLAAHPDLAESIAVPRTPAEPLPTADNSGAVCSPSAASGVFANYAFLLKPYLTSVKNQGNRGTCTAFAITSGVEMARSLAGGGLANYSEQDLYYRAKAQWSDLTNYGDGLVVGDTLGLAVSENYRFGNESSWPYNPSFSRTDVTGFYYLNSCTGYNFSLGTVYGNYCSDTAHQGGQLCVGPSCFYSSPISSASGSRVTSTYDISTSVSTIKTYLLLSKALILSFNVPSAFQSPTAGGYVNATILNSVSGAHAIHIVGTIDNAQLAITRPGAPAGDGGGYLILKNSWGSCYGDGGYVYMSYNTLAAFGYGVRVAEVAN